MIQGTRVCFCVFAKFGVDRWVGDGAGGVCVWREWGIHQCQTFVYKANQAKAYLHV